MSKKGLKVALGTESWGMREGNGFRKKVRDRLQLKGVLQKPVLEQPSATLGELENSGFLHRRAQRS